jgi:hypothetical protein
VLFYQIGGFLVELCKGLIVEYTIASDCNIFESHDTYIVYIFSSIVTFSVIRQYTNAKALRIEASNRVAMAKMFERVKNENNEYQQEFLPKLSDAIVYSGFNTQCFGIGILANNRKSNNRRKNINNICIVTFKNIASNKNNHQHNQS